MFAQTTKLNVVVCVAPSSSVAVRIMTVVPVAVGVPENVHVAELYEIPAGNADAVII